MNIVIVGLGLIGGSMAKALHKSGRHHISGLDIDSNTMSLALDEGAIAHRATDLDFRSADVIIISLHPKKTIRFVQENWEKFNKNAVVMDTCGVKSRIYKALSDLFKEDGPQFIGGHPMAGREQFGYPSASSDLFYGATLLLTGIRKDQSDAWSKLQILSDDMGFRELVETTPEEHDRIIAYTSQLAHVVSSAYIKSPTVRKEMGFSAGSFRDMTRVAKLDENMWTELFLMNHKALVAEIDELVLHLNDLRSALVSEDEIRLRKLLKEGRELKEWSNRHSQASGSAHE